MATTKNVVGPAPKPGSGLVGINLTTAGHLAGALERAAVELAGAAAAGSAVAAGGVAPSAALGLRLVSEWAAGEAASLRAVIAGLRRAEDPRVARWSGAGAPAFADPVAAHAVARRLLDALAAGRLGEARTLLGSHGQDPVVATVLVDGLGAAGIVRLLAPAMEQWALPGEAAEAQRHVVTAVADALARAGRHGTTDLSLTDLALAADREEVPRAALALLFVGGARFPAPFLREAVTQVVAPLNAALRAQPGLGPDPWLIPARGQPLDARVVVLQAVARDHQAAVEAVGAVDLDDLLPAALGYLDAGVALAEVLLEATTPVDHRGRAVREPLITTTPVHPGREGDIARRVIEWIGGHQEVPLAVQAVTGRLARPWIGSFRSAGLDGVVRRPFVVDEALGRAYLTYGQAREVVAEDLQEAAWTWAAREMDRLAGPRGRGVGFDAVGSVLGLVTVTALDADAHRAAAGDRRIARQNGLWRRVTSLALGRLPAPVRQVVGPVTAPVLGRVLADADHELRHWSELRDMAVAHDYLALDYLAASVLWSRRAANGTLAPPPQLLVDPARPDAGLRHPLDLDATDAEAWTRWRSAQAATGPAPRQLAGDQFLAETRVGAQQ